MCRIIVLRVLWNGHLKYHKGDIRTTLIWLLGKQTVRVVDGWMCSGSRPVECFAVNCAEHSDSTTTVFMPLTDLYSEGIQFEP
jgi:hypothetical protein